jgi:putative membrane protein
MRTWLRNALIASIGVLASVPALAQTPDDRSGSWHYDWDWGWGFGHMAFGGLMMLLFWGGLILVIVLAVRWLGGGPSHGPSLHPPGKRALDILQERFARGEIDKEEYQEHKRLLSE